MKPRKYLVLVMALLAVTTVAAFFVGCSEEQSSNPVTSAVTPTDNTVNPLDSVEGQKDQLQPMAATKTWSQYTQAERNMAIVYRAYDNIGQYVGQNCKEWVRTVVYSASNGMVTLPATLPNASGWYFGYSRYLVGMSGGITSVHQGSLVQMRWRLDNGTITPHTMIILYRASNGVMVIESNWCQSNCMRVNTRFITFTEFNSHVVNYTTYTVTGG